ncbi:MAG: hypothetical protein P1V18_00910 [Candidatus Gracilibacteria bacterium]|nr:hypothetical protein [Candidatus Gracilibacteria bacterium]
MKKSFKLKEKKLEYSAKNQNPMSSTCQNINNLLTKLSNLQTKLEAAMNASEDKKTVTKIIKNIHAEMLAKRVELDELMYNEEMVNKFFEKVQEDRNKIAPYEYYINEKKEVVIDMRYLDIETLEMLLIHPHSRIRSLYIQNLSAEDAIRISKILQIKNCQLKSLDISENYIGPEGGKVIAKALKSEHCQLQSLNIWDNNLGPEEGKAIGEALQSQHCQLKSLDISDNNLGPEAGKAIAEALQSKNCQLKSLDMSDNILDPEGGKAIAEALQSENCKLQNLNISRNLLGFEEINTIFEALKSEDCKLQSINMGYIMLTEKQKPLIQEIVETLRSQGKEIEISL